MSCILLSLLSLAVFAPTVFAQRTIPSLGSGPYEVIMLADYFCPPCKQIDERAEPLFKELLSTGKVKITFVDVPFNRATPLYVKYYLYAANANGEASNILHVRRMLFEAAQVKRIQTEDDLLVYLQQEKIALKPLDEKSVYPLLSVVIKEHKVDQTPTCVIKYSATDVKKFVGTHEIWTGLTAFKEHLGKVKK